MPVEDRTGSALEAEPLDRVDVLVGWKFAPSLLPALRSLRWIQNTSAGIDHLLDYWREHPDLVVTTTKGLHAEPVSSAALLMMLACHWKLPLRLQRQREHVWHSEVMPRVMSAATCAVIGLGAIGRRIAAHATELGMTVLGMSRHLAPVPSVQRLFAPEALHAMLAEADFVILALPLTERTRGMFGAAEFAAMRPSAYFINVARGGIVDEAALLHALRSGHIAGAAFDVFSEEPLPADHPLWDAPNLIVTPHMAGDRSDYVEGAAAIFAHNIEVFPDTARMRGLASRVEAY
jgi:phosphoglycerate dehydrogenase-like enzyme